ncbi:MAG: hypothetical protein OSA98_02895 [Rubripirellula sp.]|nr:hypothetical protein [Rubripirellula sp.]
MKIDRHIRKTEFPAVKPDQRNWFHHRKTVGQVHPFAAVKTSHDHPARFLVRLLALAAPLWMTAVLNAQQTAPDDSVSQAANVKESFAFRPVADKSQPDAAVLLQLVMRQLVSGAAFDAKVREIVWTTGREVIGVGTYEQAGGNTGRFNLQLTMHDGKGKHRLQQISDGRLVWTRSEISKVVTLRRVEVGKLEGWGPGATNDQPIPPRLQVGVWAEMLSTLQRDYDLSVASANLKQQAVFVISGQLREERRKAVLQKSGRRDWPLLYPTQMRVAIKAKPDLETNFGLYLPVRIEFWSDPVADSGVRTTDITTNQRRLITLVEIYSIRPITEPSAERFRFENVNVDFTNETNRYIEIHGAQLTQRLQTQKQR